MVDIQTLIQFLVEGDIFGFIQAVYVSAFQSSDVFYGVVTLLLIAPLYIRTRSLLLLSILWILLGGLFLVAMPILSGLAMLLWIFGVGGMLWTLYVAARG